jgi:hypothetical protein
MGSVFPKLRTQFKRRYKLKNTSAMEKIFEDKDYDKAEEIMLDFVGGGTWEESLQCDFSSGEVQELIAKGIKAERAQAQKPDASANTLPIQNVSQQRELLKAFLDFQQNKYSKPYDTSISEQIADFEAFNCG